jgi:hypothetical protein
MLTPVAYVEVIDYGRTSEDSQCHGRFESCVAFVHGVLHLQIVRFSHLMSAEASIYLLHQKR